MAERKTLPTKASVKEFIASIKDERRRRDCTALVTMMSKATKKKPVMWGASIVGFGDYDYSYPGSATATHWFEMGFSPRKAALTLYLLGGQDKELLARLQLRSSGSGCLYVKTLDTVDRPTLQRLMNKSAKNLRAIVKARRAGIL
jgi:hypothetical protein